MQASNSIRHRERRKSVRKASDVRVVLTTQILVPFDELLLPDPMGCVQADAEQWIEMMA